jgi:hypothetical protein
METKKYRGDIVRCYRKDNGEIVYTETGFNRQLIIVDEIGNIVHKSDVCHPEGNITTVFKNREFLVLSGNDDVYIKTIDNTFDLNPNYLNQLNIDKLNDKFNKLLEELDVDKTVLKYIK